MLHIIKKWKISAYFENRNVTIFIHDNHYSNMLRKLNEINFDFEPNRIEIHEVKLEEQEGVFIK